MPNWCDNNLTISGANDRLRQFLTENVREGKDNDYRDRVLDFNFVAPAPEENGYEWRCENWGTKWTAEVYNVQENDGYLVIGFSSAWAPPEGWVEKASRHYPDLHFYLLYEEPGIGFAGYFQAENGETAGECSELEYVDEETGDKVAYDQGKGKYIFVQSGEVIEDEDYYPSTLNPHA